MPMPFWVNPGKRGSSVERAGTFWVIQPLRAGASSVSSDVSASLVKCFLALIPVRKTQNVVLIGVSCHY
jgi:hypothetical protein